MKAVCTTRDLPKIEESLPANSDAENPEKQIAGKLKIFPKAAKKISDAIPNPSATILSVTDGTPENDYVHIRGSHKNLGKEVPRRFLTALGGNAIAPPKNASGRLELAEQVVSRKNPLTARVAANRIWHHLFGRGIVPTVDDFGPMGIPPSNPKLLDSLAASLIEGKWSQKNLIRQIVLSKTYRQSATPHPDLSLSYLADTDPENILLHKAPVRRLQAEAIRDSMLAISGRLDPKLYGNSVPVHITSFMQGRGRPGSGHSMAPAAARSTPVSAETSFLP